MDLNKDEFVIPESLRKELLEVSESFYRIASRAIPIKNKHGIISYHSRRLVFMQLDTFGEIFDEMRGMIGNAITRKMKYEFGFDAGMDVAEMFKKPSVMEAIKIMMKSLPDISGLRKLGNNDVLHQIARVLGYGRYAGWIGRAEITHYDPSSNFMRVTLKNTFESRLNRAKGVAENCNFLTGFSAGLVSGLTGLEVKANEIKCQAKQDEHCEIIVERG